MSTEQFQALIQQAKQLSATERQQLMRCLAESEAAEREPSLSPEEGLPKCVCSCLASLLSLRPVRHSYGGHANSGRAVFGAKRVYVSTDRC